VRRAPGHGLGDLAPAGLYPATAHFWDIPSKYLNKAVPLLLFSPGRVRRKGLLAR